MSIGADVECVWPAKAVLGESPCWDARTGTLYWVDIKGDRLHAFAHETGARQSWTTPHRIFSIDTPPPAWRAPEREAVWFVGCTDAGFSWIGVTSDQLILEALSHPEPDTPGNRFNDGKRGPDGRYWAGTMDDSEREPSGALYAFNETGAYERIDAGYTVANGPAFSPDGRTLYHTDSARRVIYAFDRAEDGPVANRRVFMQFGEQDGYPDGMTTDGAGNLWVAMWDGARIQKLSPSGERLGHVPIPAGRPTSCVFAGDDEHFLFVTSAAVGAPETDRLAGALFRVDLR